MKDPLSISCPVCMVPEGQRCDTSNGDPSPQVHLRRGKLVGMSGAEVLAWKLPPPSAELAVRGPDGDLPRFLLASLDLAILIAQNAGASEGDLATLRRCAEVGHSANVPRSPSIPLAVAR